MVGLARLAVQAPPGGEGGEDPEILWRPLADAREATRMGHYMTWLAENRGLAFDSYAQLWEWSVTDLAGFWASIWDFFEVHAQTPYQDVLANPTMPGARWFPGSHLNYAEHALRSTGDRVVVLSVSQTRNTIELSAAELRDQVARVRAGLVRLGVRRGDRVAAYLPNVAEAVIAFLATASLGAIWSSCAPEFGTRSVIDRLRQIEPVVLLTIDGYRNGSMAIDRTADVAAIRSALPSLRSTVVLPYLAQDPSRIPARCPGPSWCPTGGAATSPSNRFRSTTPVHSVLLRHNGAPQAHRARSRRDAPRTPQGAGPPSRPGRARPLLLVLVDRLDDVESPGRRAGRRCLDRLL